MIRWISEEIGSSSHSQVERASEIYILDVRDLVDKPGNLPQVARNKINEGLGQLKSGKRVVVCCDYGMSRSNAVAAGILSRHQNIPFDAAVREVLMQTGEREIKVDVLAAVRTALEEPAKNEGDKSAVLITGGSGFLGGALSDGLRESRKVFNPSRKEIDLLNGAVELDLFIRNHDVGCLVHLANPHVFNTNKAIGETLVMLKNVLDVCRTNSIRLIYPSGWEVFSGYIGDHNANESLPAQPKGVYGETKYLCELLLEQERRNYGLDYVLLRSGPIYGASSNRPKFIFNFLEKATRNERIVTHRYENGFPRLDLLHVDDLTDAMFRIINSDYSGTLHVGSGRGISTAEIAQLIVKMTGSSSEIEHAQIGEYVANITMDSTRAKSILGWQPRTTFEAGLESLLHQRRSSPALTT